MTCYHFFRLCFNEFIKLGQINLKPVSSNETFTMLYYFSKLPKFDRLMYDSKNSTQLFKITVQMMFPIAATEADKEAMTEFIRLAERWTELAQAAIRPIRISKCLQCCCFRNSKRTSCLCFH